MKLDPHSEVSPLTTVLLRHAREAFLSQERVDAQWKALSYTRPPQFDAALREFDSFVELLERLGVEPLFLPEDAALTLDSIYVRDPAIFSSQGIVLGRMGKPERRDEPDALARAAGELKLEIAGAIGGDGRIEGGDVVWLNSTTLAVGQGYRTNGEGLRQLRVLLQDCVEHWIEVPLPHWRGPSDVFHLMSMLSPLDDDLALVYSPLLPVPFRNQLLELGFQLVEVPDSEFESMGCNVLAVRPRQCVMLEGNPQTRRRMERAGVEVFEYQGNEISGAGCGGPTCLTRPLRGLVRS